MSDFGGLQARMAPAKPPKAVLFDIGGVCVRCLHARG